MSNTHRLHHLHRCSLNTECWSEMQILFNSDTILLMVWILKCIPINVVSSLTGMKIFTKSKTRHKMSSIINNRHYSKTIMKLQHKHASQVIDSLWRLHYGFLGVLALVQLLSRSWLALQYRFPIFVHLELYNDNLMKASQPATTALLSTE